MSIILQKKNNQSITITHNKENPHTAKIPAPLLASPISEKARGL